MIEIKNLHASVNNKPILKGITLTINPGTVHAIMGPNGSGKSTLGNVLAGKDGYNVTEGSVTFHGQNILTMAPHERALCGLFLAFQYPVEIPGVNNTYFLRTAYNIQRKAHGKPELDAAEFMQLVRDKLKLLDMDKKFLKRGVNEGFSGGEKKRNEVLQMLVLEPSFAILDETDSGLDIDALQMVSKGINYLRSPERSFIVVTHYQRLLNYIVPDFVHVLAEGRIVTSGDKSLALKLEEKGYAWIEEATA